tara:strand:- start:2286 stop:2738 length:453 start_codon:yes stop_codon:yes gene_type:complete
MSTIEKKLFKEIEVKGSQPINPYEAGTKYYRGISTVNPENPNPVLYDLALIKQDIINHFHIRQGEKLSDPSFGTIIWDALFEPLTDGMKDAITQNVTRVVSADPRVRIKSVIVDQFESGLQVEINLEYLPYNIEETMRLTFDQNAGYLAS